ncbi:MAG: universal stress protein [Acidimicrobiales bacterium]
MSKVLVATTGTGFDDGAIARALRLLGPDHQFLFLCVYHDAVPALAMAPGGITGPIPLDQPTLDQMQVDAKQQAEQAVRGSAAVFGGEAEVRVEQGNPGDTICAVAAAEEVDLIVVGSHHIGALTRILGRSVSEDVAQHAPCPVLVIPPPDS